ncbi:class I SAM-dependent methyltransferase [Fusibacter bizertensis]
MNKRSSNITEMNKKNGKSIFDYENYDIDNNLKRLLDHKLFDQLAPELNTLINTRQYDVAIPVCLYWIKNNFENSAFAYLYLAWSANGIKDYENAIRFHNEALNRNIKFGDIARGKSDYTGDYLEETVCCPGCESEDFDIVNVANQSVSEDNRGLINPIRVWVKCKNCQLIYGNPVPAEAILNKYYSIIAKEKFGGIYGNIDERFEYLVAMSNRRLEKIESYSNGVGSLLDIGTGIGIFTGVAIDRNWNAEGLEFAPEDCEYASTNFDLDLLNEDFYNFNSDRQYDVVTLFEVIEHLHHPLKDLKQINKLIVPGGVLVVATPIQDSLYGKKMKEHNIFWNVITHLTYFTKPVMIDYLNEAGFEIIEINNSNEGMGRMEFYCRKK